MTWKPKSEYPKDSESPPLVIVRHKDHHTGPSLVIWNKVMGHFYVCPGVPMWYGNHQFGLMVNDYFDEFTEIPE